MTNNTEFTGFSDKALKAIAYIWHEAAILDKKDYLTWEGFWLEEGRYVVPIDPTVTDHFDAHLNYLNDDARMRRLRVDRLTSGNSPSVVDAANTVRTISRFCVTSETEEVIELTAAQVVFAYKYPQHDTFAADVTYKIKFVNGQPKLLQKVVYLINSEDSLDAIGFLL